MRHMDKRGLKKLKGEATAPSGASVAVVVAALWYRQQAEKVCTVSKKLVIKR